MDVDVLRFEVFGRVADFKEHRPAVLVEPFGGCVDVVVGARVRAADNHDREAGVVNAEVVDGRLQEVRVLFEPARLSLFALFEILEAGQE